MTSFMALIVHVRPYMGAHKGQYGFMRGSICGSHEQAVMGSESQAVSARVTSHFITILVKHVIRTIIRLQDIISCKEITFYRELRSAYHINVLSVLSSFAIIKMEKRELQCNCFTLFVFIIV